jgi:hypothetical protein
MSGLVAVAMSMAAGLAAVAGPAAASPEDCLNGANGFVPTPDSVQDSAILQERQVDPDLTVTLMGGTIGEPRAWARVAGPTPDGTQFWLDWRKDDGVSWIRCGPFTAGSMDDSRRTPAQRRTPTGSLRACATPPGSKGPGDCTPWGR